MKMILKRTAALVVGLMLGVGAWAGLETVTHISDLNSSWPLGSDLASTSDDHIRNIKVALKTDFPNINAAVTGTPTQLNNLTSNISISGTTASAAAFAVTGSTVPANGIYLQSANVLAFATNTLSAGSINSGQQWTIPAQAAANVVGSTVPANGIYLPSANTLGIATNTTARATISSAGAWSITAPASSTAVGVNGIGTNPGLDLNNNNSAVGNPPLRLLNANASAQTPIDWFSNGSLSGRIRNDFAGNMTIVNFSSGGLAVFTGGDSGTGTQRFSVNASSPFIQGYGTTAAGLVDLTPDTGTFTATMTGGTTSPTCTARWTRVGNLVMLELCSATATSNATTFTYTGLPAAVQPTVGQNVAMAIALDNGVAAPLITAQLAAASGTITFFKSASSTGWTNVGTKGLSVVNTISYLLN